MIHSALCLLRVRKPRNLVSSNGYTGIKFPCIAAIFSFESFIECTTPKQERISAHAHMIMF
jgi:hypothetical protein